MSMRQSNRTPRQPSAWSRSLTGGRREAAGHAAVHALAPLVPASSGDGEENAAHGSTGIFPCGRGFYIVKVGWRGFYIKSGAPLARIQNLPAGGPGSGAQRPAGLQHARLAQRCLCSSLASRWCPGRRGRTCWSPPGRMQLAQRQGQSFGINLQKQRC